MVIWSWSYGRGHMVMATLYYFGYRYGQHGHMVMVMVIWSWSWSYGRGRMVMVTLLWLQIWSEWSIGHGHIWSYMVNWSIGHGHHIYGHMVMVIMGILPRDMAIWPCSGSYYREIYCLGHMVIYGHGHMVVVVYMVMVTLLWLQIWSAWRSYMAMGIWSCGHGHMVKVMGILPRDMARWSCSGSYYRERLSRS